MFQHLARIILVNYPIFLLLIIFILTTTGKSFSTQEQSEGTEWTSQAKVHPSHVFDWPQIYHPVLPNRTDSDGDGLLECRYKVDASHWALPGSPTPDCLNDLNWAIDQWNRALNYVGLEMKEVQDDSYHLVIKLDATLSLPTAESFTAFSKDPEGADKVGIVMTGLRIRRTLNLLENDAPKALYKNPPGNPFIYIFGFDDAPDTMLSTTYLIHLGRLMGLVYPEQPLPSGDSNGLFIDWLAHPTIGNEPPKERSNIFAGENFVQANWPTEFLNSMTVIPSHYGWAYPQLPAPEKAFVAHYYGRYNPKGAQKLLDEAIADYHRLSPIARGEMSQETEPNDTVEQADTLLLNRPVLGALTKATLDTYEKLYEYDYDWYTLSISEQEVGHLLKIDISLASEYNLNLYTWQLTVTTPDKQIITGNFDKNPIIHFTPQQPGTYFICYGNNNAPGSRDYVLAARLEEINMPTPTPTGESSVTDWPFRR